MGDEYVIATGVHTMPMYYLSLSSSAPFLYIYKNQLFRPRLFRINATITTLFSVQFCKRLLAQVALRVGCLSSLDSAPEPTIWEKSHNIVDVFVERVALKLRGSDSGQ